MSPFWLAPVPFAYLMVAAVFSPGLRRQPEVVHAWSPEKFQLALDWAGGPAELRRGLRLDLIFILLFVVIGTALLAGSTWWVVPLVAGLLDLVEFCLLRLILNRGVQRRLTRTLAIVATTKLLAYGLAVVAIGVAWCRSSSA